MTISDRAMLVSPAWSVWTARRYDKAVSKKVADEHKSSERRAGRYNKCLIDVDDPLYKAIKAIEGESRRYHEDHTLPWSQDGSRILPAEMYFDYTAQMTLYREKFEHAVKEFIEAYPQMVEKAKVDLNGLFRASDYPTTAELKHKFGMRMFIFPVPEANDFRVNLEKDDVAEIRSNIEKEVEGAVRTAERARWERLLEPVSHAVERLSDPEAIFRDSLIKNIRDAVSTLPKLALKKDEDFEHLLNEVKEKLAPYNPKDLRDDPRIRAQAARKAAEIARRMSTLMGK